MQQDELNLDDGENNADTYGNGDSNDEMTANGR